MGIPTRPQMERLKWPLTARQVEALDNMLEQLFRATRRSSSLTLDAGTLAGRGSGAGAGPVEQITLGTALSIVANELQVSFAGHDALAELVDVLLTGLADNDLLQYDSGTGKWVNVTVASVLAAAGAVIESDLPNVGYWSPLSNGDATVPELIFANGDTIAVWTPT